MAKKLYPAIVFFVLTIAAHASVLLVPMDATQHNHLKAYGVTYRVLSRGGTAGLLLNYRGGSFALPDAPENETECTGVGVSYQRLNDEDYNKILEQIDQSASNMAVVKLDRSPKIAVYAPKSEQPWDDAVVLALNYAGIPYDKIYDDEVLDGKLNRYDWLHVHHEDFTGQYGKFYAAYSRAAWYNENQADEEMRAARHGFSKVSKMKLEVCHRIRDFVAAGGYMFAMCSAPESFDIALAAENTDICQVMFDHDPVDPDAQSKLDYAQCFAFQNWHLNMNPLDYAKSDIDVGFQRTIPRNADYFNLTNYDAKLYPAEAMLCQNHVSAVKGFMGQSTAFNKKYIKPGVLIMGQDAKGTEARYIHGEYGNGMWTWYGGHDPEAYQHLVGDGPTDLDKYPNSPGYRLILNNVFMQATTTPVEDNAVAPIKVYPNPAGTYVNVAGQTSGSLYLLFDQAGKVIQSGVLNSENEQLDISRLTGGLYLLQVEGTAVKIVKGK